MSPLPAEPIPPRDPACPFPGFRPFEEHESAFFFGRRQPTFDIIDRLARSSLVAVVGASGSGKSSLVRCGVFPALHRGLMGAAGSSWRLVRARPRNDPIGELAAGLAAAGLWPQGGSDAAEMIEATLRRDAFGLLDVADQAELEEDENLLVFIDQFEELFRYADLTSTGRTRDDIGFVQLLLEAASRTREALATSGGTGRRRVFILLTMRSDFLGHCSPYHGLARWINDGFYLTPLLDRDQRREVIEGPIAMAGGSITPRLVNRLLNDAGDDPSTLPALQHALMRIWHAWRDRIEHGPPVREADPARMDLCDYRRVARAGDGDPRLEAVLDVHLDEVLAELPGSRDLVRCVFQRLTETLDDGLHVRRAATLRELAAVCAVPPEDPSLSAAVDAFRREGRTFLVPRDGDLEPGTLVDISHESLIANWSVLRDEWMPAEVGRVAAYDPLAEQATKWRADPSCSLYRGKELRTALDWRRRFTTEAQARAWAAPYDRRARRPDGYRDATAFLTTSRAARRNRRLGLAATVAVLLGIGGTFWWRDAQRARAEAFREHVRLARIEAQRDPLVGARLLAEKAGDDDVGNVGFLAALDAVSGAPLPRAAISVLDTVRALSLAASGERLVIVGDSAGAGRAWVWSGGGAGRLDRIAQSPGPDLVDAWFEPTGAGVLLAGRGAEPGGGGIEVPEGWSVRTIPRGWTGREVVRSPDGRRLAAMYAPEDGGSPHACLWTLAQAPADLPSCGAGTPGATVVELSALDHLSFSGTGRLVAWSRPTTSGRSAPDSSRIVVAGDGDPAIRRAVGHARADRIVAADVHPTGAWLAAAMRAGTIRLWDLSTPGRSCTLRLGATPLALRFLADSTLLGATSDGQIRRWTIRRGLTDDGTDCESGETPDSAIVTGTALVYDGSAGVLASARIAPDGTVYAFASSGGATTLRPPPNNPGAPLTVRGHPARAVLAASAGDLLATADASGEVRTWSRGADWWAIALTDGPEPIRSDTVVRTDADGDRFALRDAGSVTIWDRSAGAPVGASRDVPGGFPRLSPDGRRFGVPNGDTAWLYLADGGAGAPPIPLPHASRLVAVEFLEGGDAVLSAEVDGVVRISRTRDGSEARSFTVPLEGLRLKDADGASSANPLVTALAGDFTDTKIQVWGSSDRRGAPYDATQAVNRIVVDPDGDAVVALLSGGARLLFIGDPAAGEAMPSVEIPGSVEHAAFLPGGRLVTTPGGGGASEAVVWDIAVRRADGSRGLEPLETFRLPGRPTGIDVARRTGELVTTGSDGLVRVWPLSWKRLAARIRELTASPSRGEGP